MLLGRQVQAEQWGRQDQVGLPGHQVLRVQLEVQGHLVQVVQPDRGVARVLLGLADHQALQGLE